MTKTELLAVVAGIVVVGIGGNVWLLVQEARGRVRTRGWNTRLLRGLSIVCAAIICGTAVFARPWYWDLALAAGSVAAAAGTLWLLRSLWRPPRPGLGRAILASSGAMVLGVALLGLAGVAGVLDAASLSSASPVLTYHGGGVLRTPELIQVFWGPEWRGSDPSVKQGVELQKDLPGSSWAKAVASSGFGVTGFTDGGCWIDPSSPAPRTVVTTTTTGPFAQELQAVFHHRHAVSPCPGSQPRSVPESLPPDIVVALWLPPSVPFNISGVAAHGWAEWPGRPQGLVVAGLPGGYANWGLPSCVQDVSCASIPPYAYPSYALSHELLEAVTNPYGGGWYAPPPLSWTAAFVLSNGPPSLLGFGPHPSYPGEVADLCEPGSVAPGQRLVIGRLDSTSPLPVAPFYSPGVGCVG